MTVWTLAAIKQVYKYSSLKIATELFSLLAQVLTVLVTGNKFIFVILSQFDTGYRK